MKTTRKGGLLVNVDGSSNRNMLKVAGHDS